MGGTSSTTIACSTKTAPDFAAPWASGSTIVIA
jgi:hypothetical protein